MAVMNVNPTRMELSKLKKKLLVATRGHKLLKDKRDELMRQFILLIKENKVLREEVEEAIGKANVSINTARSLMQKQVLDTSLMCPTQKIELSVSEKNIMSVDIPVFSYETKTQNPGDIFSYGFANTSGALDEGISILSENLVKMLSLAEKENAAQLMATEIESTRRRVNALEHVMIPDLKDTIRFITMKLDENERANQTRLMKVKDMVIDQKISKREI
jgi:V/A-type H+-transporting ATPase subunit D